MVRLLRIPGMIVVCADTAQPQITSGVTKPHPNPES